MENGKKIDRMAELFSCKVMKSRNVSYTVIETHFLDLSSISNDGDKGI